MRQRRKEEEEEEEGNNRTNEFHEFLLIAVVNVNVLSRARGRARSWGGKKKFVPIYNRDSSSTMAVNNCPVKNDPFN